MVSMHTIQFKLIPQQGLVLATMYHELIFVKPHYPASNTVNIVRHFLYGEALRSDLSLLDKQ